ncbi:hypothetical protein Hanom_Chr01g00087391 [Helianthus anomalus]
MLRVNFCFAPCGLVILTFHKAQVHKLYHINHLKEAYRCFCIS